MGRRRARAVPQPATGLTRLLAAVVLAAVLPAAVVAGCSSDAGQLIGRPAPLFDSFDLTGRPVSLHGLRGRPVLINFWASWCVPCRQEFPILSAALAGHPRLNVLGVVHQDAKANAARFFRAEGATWTSVVDPSNQIASAYEVNGIPVTVAVDPAGVVRGRTLGVLTTSSAQRLIALVGG